MKTLNHSGGYDDEATPVPIPNTEVKLVGVQDTWLETARENRSLPDYAAGLYEARLRKRSRASSFLENETKL